MNKIPDDQFNQTLNQLMGKPWVVYAKPAGYGSDKLIDYLGRYTRRIALTPNRLIDLNNNQVSLKYRDYRDGKNKVMKLSVEELLRRYALHILPKGFMRVRYHGFLANAVRAEKLQAIRRALNVIKVVVEDEKPLLKGNPYCPDCGQNHWHYVGVIKRLHWNPG